MPIYEYDCPKCGRFELIQKISEKELTDCPQCAEKGKKQAVKRAVSASSFHLKGSGWYKTDYSSSGSAGTATSAATSETKAATPAAESKTESTESTPKKKGGCGSGCGCH